MPLTGCGLIIIFVRKIKLTAIDLSQTKLNGKTFGCDKIINIDQLDNGDEDAHDILKYLSYHVVAKEIVSG